MVTSDAILDELDRVLRSAKFAWPAEEAAKALRQLARLAERVVPTHTLNIISDDPSDNRILECADAGDADYIVGGDKHLLKLVQHGRAPILRVADFLRLPEESRERTGS